MYYSSGNYEAFARPKKPEGVDQKSAYIVGSGLAALTAACYLVRDGQMKGEHVHIGGLTKSQAENMIKEKLKTYIKENPIVNVRMANYKISVMGEVAHPGTFTITNEKVNIMEALAMAGDMTVYGQRDKVKLIREDAQGNRQVIPLNLNDADIIVSPYYYLQQNDVVYVTPNKTKAKNASISNSTTIWFSVVGTLVALASLIVTIAK